MPSDEIRMRGFLRRTSLSECLTLLEQHCPPLDAERVSVEQAVGRVLTEALTAPVNVPHFHRAAMDGYAVQGEDTFGAGLYQPLPLHVIGQSLPGRPFSGRVRPGEAVEIMTGAPLPEGADAVVPAESTEREQDEVRVLEALPPWRHVSRVGEDLKAGDELLPEGRQLRPQDLGLLASVGETWVSVRRCPTVTLLLTGSELLAPGTVPKGAQIVDSNSVMLQPLVARDGGQLQNVQRLPDDPEALRAALETADTDVVIVTGGTSVGLEDQAPSLVAELGRLLVHGIPMKPAAPTGFGVIGTKRVFLLPGNPVSALCAYDCLVARALRLLGGRAPEWPYRPQTVRLKTKLSSQIGRVEYVRLRVEGDEASVLASAGASILSSTTRADAFFLTEEHSEGLASGETIVVWRY